MSRPNLFHWIACLAVSLLLMACGGMSAGTQTLPPTSSSTPTKLPTATATQAPSAKLTPTPTLPRMTAGQAGKNHPPTTRPFGEGQGGGAATRKQPPALEWTATATIIPRPPATPTSTPVLDPLWLVRNVKIPNWPVKGYFPWWEDQNTIKININAGYQVIDVSDVGISTPHQPVMPAFLKDAENHSYKYSPNHTYLLKCTSKDQNNEYHGLQLFRTADEQLISQVNNLDFWCLWGTRWASDESVLSFATKSANYDYDSHSGTNIYVWKVDGTAPYVIGDGTFEDEPGTWSPDSKRLVVEIRNPHPTSPDDEEIYQIFYLDGRPPRIIKASLGVRAMPGLDWITDNVLYELNTCCGNCSFHDYHVAETGENLADLYWSDCSSGWEISNQHPLTSPDDRWFVIDKTDHDNWGMQGKDWKQTLAYVLYDLQAYQPYTVSATADLYLDFVGWAGDSSGFYVVRRPITDTVIEQPEAPFGLLALDPYTRQYRLLNPDIRYAWLSPDRQHLFGYSHQGQGFSAALYNLDGSLLTAPQPVSASPSRYFEPGDVGELRIAWANNSTLVVFNDMWGNLWLANINGSSHRLASGLPLPDSDHITDDLYIVSPDDTRLLVTSNDRAWVVYLP